MARHNDEEPDADYSRFRKNDGISVGWGKGQLRATGPFAIVAICVVLTMSVLIYVNWKGFQDIHGLLGQSLSQHENMVRSQDITACVVSLSVSDRVYTRNLTTKEDFARLCPWLRQ